MIEIKEYLAPTGRSPFADWLLALKDVTTRARVLVRLNRIRLGNFGDTKHVGEGVYELRLAFGPGYRIYYSRDGKTVILLLCAGSKQTQQQDIERAKAHWRDYIERSDD
jgi:putative addiction module killer protein